MEIFSKVPTWYTETTDIPTRTVRARLAHDLRAHALLAPIPIVAVALHHVVVRPLAVVWLLQIRILQAVARLVHEAARQCSGEGHAAPGGMTTGEPGLVLHHDAHILQGARTIELAHREETFTIPMLARPDRARGPLCLLESVNLRQLEAAPGGRLRDSVVTTSLARVLTGTQLGYSKFSSFANI